MLAATAVAVAVLLQTEAQKMKWQEVKRRLKRCGPRSLFSWFYYDKFCGQSWFLGGRTLPPHSGSSLLKLMKAVSQLSQRNTILSEVYTAGVSRWHRW
jgi:hypothetical protein